MNLDQKRRVANAAHETAIVVAELEGEGRKRGVTKLKRAICFLHEAMKAGPNG